MKRLGVLLVCAGISGILALGCGGDDDDDDSACEAAGTAICAAACDCRDGDACGITDEEGAATISFDNEEDCRNLYINLGCAGGGSGIDFDACASDVEAAECLGDGEARAVILPASCDDN